MLNKEIFDDNKSSMNEKEFFDEFERFLNGDDIPEDKRKEMLKWLDDNMPVKGE